MERDIDRSGFPGMTGNERLSHLGLLEQFDAAERRRDRETMIRLLEMIDYTPEDAAKSADICLRHLPKT